MFVRLYRSSGKLDRGEGGKTERNKADRKEGRNEGNKEEKKGGKEEIKEDRKAREK